MPSDWLTYSHVRWELVKHLVKHIVYFYASGQQCLQSKLICMHLAIKQGAFFPIPVNVRNRKSQRVTEWRSLSSPVDLEMCLFRLKVWFTANETRCAVCVGYAICIEEILWVILNSKQIKFETKVNNKMSTCSAEEFIITQNMTLIIIMLKYFISLEFPIFFWENFTAKLIVNTSTIYVRDHN